MFRDLHPDLNHQKEKNVTSTIKKKNCVFDKPNFSRAKQLCDWWQKVSILTSSSREKGGGVLSVMVNYVKDPIT